MSAVYADGMVGVYSALSPPTSPNHPTHPWNMQPPLKVLPAQYQILEAEGSDYEVELVEEFNP